MDNFIGKKNLENGGFSFDAYWILHGTPRGEMLNNGKDDPREFIGYSEWHTYGDTHIKPHPSVPGAKFIKEEVPGCPGCFAYSFLRTGIYEATSSRPGSNYGAITIIMDDMDEEHTKKFARELQKWFKEVILDRFTSVENPNGWLRWTNYAEHALFRGKYDKELKNSIQVLLAPYLSIKKSAEASNETERINSGTQELREEIAKLEQQKQEIERLLAEKRAQLRGL